MSPAGSPLAQGIGHNGRMNSRSPIVIGAVLVVLLVGLGFFLLLRTGSGAAPAPAPAPEPTVTPSPTEGTPTVAPDPTSVAQAQTTTVLRVRVPGCNGCQVTAVADNPEGQRKWSATVADGVAQLELPTPNTLGMAFFVQGERDGIDTRLRTLVALQPDEVAPGSPVSGATIQRADTTGYCWAGTTLNVATMQFQARENNGRVNQAWANPALPTLTPTVKLGGKPETPIRVACASAQ